MKRMRYIREDASKTPSKEFRPRRLNEISGIGKKAYVVLMNLYGDDTDSGEDETYVLAKKYNLRDAAAAYFKECRECSCLGESGMISLVSYIIGDKVNTMNTITYYTNADWFDACDRNGLDCDHEEITDWSLVTDSQGWKLDGSDIDRMYESAGSKRPGGKPYRTGRLVESDETRYVEAEEGLELMDQGYELSGRGYYASYRFTKVPGSDEVDYWYLDRDENWDNGYWTVDEFLKNMSSYNGVKMLYVSREPRVSESGNPDRNSRKRRKLNESEKRMYVVVMTTEEEDENEELVERNAWIIWKGYNQDGAYAVLEERENEHISHDDMICLSRPTKTELSVGEPHPDKKDHIVFFTYTILNVNNPKSIRCLDKDGTPFTPMYLPLYKSDTVDESGNPDRNSRRRRKLNESVKYDSLTKNGQEHMDELVKDLQNAKTRFERIIYGNNVKDEETLTELQEMHNGVCSILNELPW